MNPLKICFITAEAVPFAKTGGLADVAGALPPALSRRGHEVRVIMPLHGTVDTDRYTLTPVEFMRGLEVDLGGQRVRFSVFVAPIPGTRTEVYFISCPRLFHRPSVYTGDWDEHLRFALLGRAAFECCQRMGWAPDILHANDWHAALVPLYRKVLYGWDHLFAAAKTVLTIHNLAYQGVFPADTAAALGLANHLQWLDRGDLEAGRISFLKTGILHADVITTVSRTYALEIQTEAFGMGLEGLLRHRGGSVLGIVNGVDYGQWDPSVDPHIARNYGPEDVAEGKRENKIRLLADLGLPYEEGVPVLGIVSRLTPQKGFDLCFDALPRILAREDLRLCVLGSGESRYEDFFHQLARHFPNKVCYYRGYHEPLAHRIEAGSDIFLMPSRFEPCGLNQMYSLRYGTPPVVRRTGGLADTVELWNPHTGEGTGFVFEHFDAAGLEWAIRYALATFRQPESWAKLRRNGMQKDFSWDLQAAEYERLYRLLRRR